MKPGELRRFDDTRLAGSYDTRRVAGKLFVIVAERADNLNGFCVDILLDGAVETSWGYDWVNIHSEVVSEAR